ncbi:MAG: hypothetical protein EOO64_05760, partial [Massilia sp.]
LTAAQVRESPEIGLLARSSREAGNNYYDNRGYHAGYVQPRPVYREHWRHGHGGDHWRHGGGRHWDRDGDGVPNRHDRRPNNPYRY